MNDFEKTSPPKSLIEKAEEIEKKLKANRKDEFSKQLHYDLFKDNFEKNGAVESLNWQKKLEEIARSGKIIVRRENFEKILNVLEKKQSLQIHSSEDRGKQPNAAILGNDLSGLKIALAGGFESIGDGSVVVTVGFKPSENLMLQDLPASQFVNFQGGERHLTKIVEGEVPFKDIKFLLLRMPRDFFPEEEMTNFELEKKPAHIQRMYLIEDQENEKRTS